MCKCLFLPVISLANGDTGAKRQSELGPHLKTGPLICKKRIVIFHRFSVSASCLNMGGLGDGYPITYLTAHKGQRERNYVVKCS